MDREQLKEILPHREPMLLLDSSEVVDGIACGTYKVRGDEFFLQGHFPGNPVVPGDEVSIRCELTKHKGPFYFASGKVFVGEDLCVSGEFSIALMPKKA